MILVAHEDSDVAKTLANYLRKEQGYAAEVVDDAYAVVEAIQRLRPELLLITDGFAYGTHGLTGGKNSFDVVAEIRKCPEIARLPMAMLCYGEQERQWAREAGCPTTLPFPVHPDELMAPIRSLLGAGRKEQ